MLQRQSLKTARPMDDATTLTDSDRRYLLRLARDTIEAVVRSKPRPRVVESELSESLLRPADTFVTLFLRGQLRGCIGSRSGREPLYRSVMDSAEASATRDPRFPPVAAWEVPELEISVSVLTPTRPIQWSTVNDLRERIQPFVHGVVLSNGVRRALYLPQVWEHFAGDPDAHAAFLSSLSRKAGDPTGTLWKDPGTRYEIFEAETFRESDYETSTRRR